MVAVAQTAACFPRSGSSNQSELLVRVGNRLNYSARIWSPGYLPSCSTQRTAAAPPDWEHLNVPDVNEFYSDNVIQYWLFLDFENVEHTTLVEFGWSESEGVWVSGAQCMLPGAGGKWLWYSAARSLRSLSASRSRCLCRRRGTNRNKCFKKYILYRY